MSALPPPLPPQSPPVQPLPVAAIRLPQYSFVNAFSAGWNGLTANWGVLTLATLVTGLIALVAWCFPYVGWAAGLFAAPIGSSLLFMGTRAARGEKPRFDWLFSQLRPYWPLFVINLFHALLGLAVVPFFFIQFGGMGLGAIITESGWGVLGGAICCAPLLISAIIAATYLHVRWYLAQFIVLDDPANATGPIDAMRRSWELTRGRSLSFFGLLVVLTLADIVGMAALLVGSILFTAPLAVAVKGAAYALIIAEVRSVQQPTIAPTSPDVM